MCRPDPRVLIATDQKKGPTSRLKRELCPTLLFFSTYIWMRKRPGVGRFEGLGRVGESNIETIAIVQA